MYGNYELPLNLKVPELEIDVTKQKYGFNYVRKLSDKPDFEKIILSDKAKLIVNPVEPCNYPQQISIYLMLELKKQLILAPGSEKRLFLTFPIEIGVFLFTRSDYEPLDEISLLPVKYTLYGDPRNGIVARYFRTDIYSSIPALDPLKYGILDLKLKNTDSHWNKVTKLVLNAFDMKLSYNSDIVKMYAEMKIINETTAETDCYLPALEKGFKKSKEIFRVKKLNILSTKFNMLDGI